MNRIRLALIVVVVFIVTLGLGYAWGASGRFTLSAALDDSRQLLDLAEARGHLLDARVSLYNVNFGDASREFEEAKAPLRRAQDRYQQAGKSAAANGIAAAVEHAAEGQRLASKLDQSANTKAADALEAIKVAGQK
ncbi:MAG: hypothetical protein ABIX28_17875 [Vicinamibacterales bacterium]